MMRQPARTLLLMLLIALSAFVFVLRTVEYVVVSNQLNEIGEGFSITGFIQHPDGGHGNVSHAAAIMAESGFIAQEDRRRVFEGTIFNRTTADISGMVRGVGDDVHQLRLTDVYFYGLILDIYIPPAPDMTHWLLLRVQHRYTGITEHANAGQMMNLGFYPHLIGEENFQKLLYIHENEPSFGYTLAPAQIGPRRFLFRARYFEIFGIDGLRWPTISAARHGRNTEPLMMMPLNDGEGVWFWQNPPSRGLDFANIPELSHLVEEIALLRHHQRGLHIIGTRDFSIAPDISRHDAPVRHVAGRTLTYEDYLEGNMVAYVDNRFLRWRNYRIGDSFIIRMHREQFITRAAPGFDQPIVQSRPGDDFYTFRLTIVGTFSYFGPPSTFATTFVYVPLSIIPESLQLSPPIHDINFGHEPDYLAAAWYSFTISDPTRNQEMLDWAAEHPVLSNYNIIILGGSHEALNFMASAQPVLLTALFNAVVFGIVALLVLILAGFIFVRQRQRDVAIYRALGNSSAKVACYMLGTLLFFGVPAIVLGAFAGWHSAQVVAITALEPFADFMRDAPVALHPILRPPPPQVVEFDVGLGHQWLAGLMAVVLLVLAVVMLVAASRILRLSVLAMLQGAATKRLRERKRLKDNQRDSVAGEAANTLTTQFTTHNQPLEMTNKSKIKAAWGWILRHMRRSVAKSVLGLVVALFFVIAIGWLQEATVRNQAEVDRLYDTTLVKGGIGPNLPGHQLVPVGSNNLFQPGFMGDVIRHQTLGHLRQYEHLFEYIYIESGFARSFFVPSPDGLPTNGVLPENWEELSGINTSIGLAANFPALDRLRTFSHFDIFVEENTDHTGSIAFEFAQGFCPAEFMDFRKGGRIPVIASPHAMHANNLALGDYIDLGFFAVTISTIRSFPAQIVGVHNGHILRDFMDDTSLIPLSAFEYALGGSSNYSLISFQVDTGRNRDIVEIRETLEYVARTTRGHLGVQMHLFLRDEELRNTTTAVGQTVLLLELMYPVALTVAVVIAAVLSMLLMLQSAKNAAIMRVLGTGKAKARYMLATELIVVCIGGLIFGAVWLLSAGWGFGPTQILIVTAVYLGGALFGSLIGAVVVTKKPPLELLQVRE